LNPCIPDVKWYTGLGVNPHLLRVREHESNELSHYSKATSDIEYQFPWGWGEIQGIANRTDFDLKAHTDLSGERLTYFDQESGKHITPYVIEPSAGVDRTVMTLLTDAYSEEETSDSSGKSSTRTFLKLHPSIAPVKVAILPLSRSAELSSLSKSVYDLITESRQIKGYIQYDESQSIGRRYRRQDEIGTPLCVTIDFE